MDVKKKCTNQGCGKQFTDSENGMDKCIYHDGNPMFHDVKKGWTCCSQIVYDWEEFTKLKGCKVGAHTDAKKDTNFFKSSAVDNAQKGMDNNPSDSQPEKKVQSIADYELEQKRVEEEKKKQAEQKPKEVIKSSDGKYFCSNPGCTKKTYDPNDNEEGSCQHHGGQPIFHDRKKAWNCCKQEAYDWDDFLLLKPCVIGKHNPKYKA